MKTMISVFLVAFLFAGYSQEEPIVIQGRNKLIDDVLVDLLVDTDRFHGQRVTFENVTYVEFGFNGREIAFFECHPWFRQSGTYGFNRSLLMMQSSFTFWFQPSEPGSKRLALQMAGKYYLAPKLLDITGIYYYHQIPYGPQIHLFLVESFSLDGVEYQGTIPSRVTE